MIKVNKETGEIENYTPEKFEAEKFNLIKEWNDAKYQLDLFKEKEMNLRKLIVTFAFDPAKKKGVQTIPLTEGWKLKATKKESRSFIKNQEGKTDKLAIQWAYNEICNKGPEWKEIADQIIIFKPELSETGYYKSTKDIQEIIDRKSVV